MDHVGFDTRAFSPTKTHAKMFIHHRDSPFYIFQIIPPNAAVATDQLRRMHLEEMTRTGIYRKDGVIEDHRITVASQNGGRILVIFSPPCFGHFHCCQAGP